MARVINTVAAWRMRSNKGNSKVTPKLLQSLEELEMMRKGNGWRGRLMLGFVSEGKQTK